MKQLLCVVNLLKYEKHLKCLTDPLPPGKAGEPGLYHIKTNSFLLSINQSKSQNQDPTWIYVG